MGLWHLQSYKQLICPVPARSAISGSRRQASVPRSIARPASAPPLSSWSSTWQPAAPATYRGSGPHRGVPALGGLRLLPIHGLGGAPNLLSPHAEEEEEKEGSAGSPPGQLPLASASLDSDRGRKRRLLPPPRAQPGNTLFMLSQSSCPHPPEAQFQPRAQGGRRGSAEGRATHKRGRPGPQPFAASPRGAACTFPP